MKKYLKLLFLLIVIQAHASSTEISQTLPNSNAIISPNEAFIANYTNNKLNLISTLTGMSVKYSVNLPNIQSLVFTKNSDLLIGSNKQTKKLYFIHASNGAILKEFDYIFDTLSSDGKFVVAHDASNIYMLNTSGGTLFKAGLGKITRTIPGQFDNITLSPDNNFIAAINKPRKELNIITLKTGTLIKVPYINLGVIKGISNNNILLAYDPITRENLVFNINNQNTYKFKNIFTKSKIAPNGKFIVIENSKTNSLDIVNLKGNNLKTISNINQTNFEISPNSKFILGYNYNKLNKKLAIKIVNIETDEILYQKEIFNNFYLPIDLRPTFSKDGKFATIVNTLKNILSIIDLSLNTKETIIGKFSSVQISPKNNFILAYNLDKNKYEVIDLKSLNLSPKKPKTVVEKIIDDCLKNS